MKQSNNKNPKHDTCDVYRDGDEELRQMFWDKAKKVTNKSQLSG